MSEVNNEIITNNVEATVDPVVEAVEEVTAAPVVETVEETVSEESPRKSIFTFFKKDKAGNTVTEEVPVDSTAAKKSKYCGLCCRSKKEASPAETTETATEEAVPVDEEAVVAEEAAVVPDEEPVVAEPYSEVFEVVDAPAIEHEDEGPLPGETVEEQAAAAAIDAVPEVCIARSGVLFKSGKFFKSHMNERHCRLLKTGVFQWSKTEDFTKAHECKVCGETTTVSFMAEGENTPHKYRFEAHCCGNVTTFATDSEEDRDEWVRTIETVKEAIAPVESYAEVVVEEAQAEVAAEEAQAAAE